MTYFGTSTLRDIINGKNDSILDVSFSPDGLYLATYSTNSLIRVSSLVFDTNKSQACLRSGIYLRSTFAKSSEVQSGAPLAILISLLTAVTLPYVSVTTTKFAFTACAMAHIRLWKD